MPPQPRVAGASARRIRERRRRALESLHRPTGPGESGESRCCCRITDSVGNARLHDSDPGLQLLPPPSPANRIRMATACYWEIKQQTSVQIHDITTPFIDVLLKPPNKTRDINSGEKQAWCKRNSRHCNLYSSSCMYRYQCLRPRPHLRRAPSCRCFLLRSWQHTGCSRPAQLRTLRHLSHCNPLMQDVRLLLYYSRQRPCPAHHPPAMAPAHPKWYPTSPSAAVEAVAVAAASVVVASYSPCGSVRPHGSDSGLVAAVGDADCCSSGPGHSPRATNQAARVLSNS